MKIRIFVLVVGGLLQACAAEHEASSDAPELLARAACGDTCAARAEFDFQLSGTRLSAWEGRKVAAAAIERGNVPGAASRVVLLTSAIRNGQFSLFCPQSLAENYAYPSYAAFVDVNGDGRCSAGDVGYQAQLFGWNWDVDDELSVGSWTPVVSLPAPIGRPAASFCAGYFE